uniref:Uncharacterized protein n=1 Tax=Ditylenchus dipsaci TaxID=166011 RepID=A0A915E7D8_9BILA
MIILKLLLTLLLIVPTFLSGVFSLDSLRWNRDAGELETVDGERQGRALGRRSSNSRRKRSHSSRWRGRWRSHSRNRYGYGGWGGGYHMAEAMEAIRMERQLWWILWTKLWMGKK